MKKYTPLQVEKTNVAVSFYYNYTKIKLKSNFYQFVLTY